MSSVFIPDLDSKINFSVRTKTKGSLLKLNKSVVEPTRRLRSIDVMDMG